MEHYPNYQDRRTVIEGAKGLPSSSLGDSVKRIKPSTVQGDLSPIMERISLLADEVSHAHANITELESRLGPILALDRPADCSESTDPAQPCEMEGRLSIIYNHVRGLNARITALRSELRI